MRKCRGVIATGGIEMSVSEAGEAFRSYVQEAVHEYIIGVMAKEVEVLCGPRYRPHPSGRYSRAGSAPGYVLQAGRRLEVVRPRVRQKGASGSAEVLLRSYVDAQEPGELHRRLLSSFQSGVSSREQKRLHGEASIGASRSEVSRLWRNEGKKLLVKFRERDIQRDDWLVLMLDGVVLERDLVAVVALGITADGTKRLLDFEFGASENAQTSKRLLERLQSRGFSPASGCRLLAVLDGSTALKTAVSAYYPDAVFQRCLVHKERNIRRYLLRREHGELACLFDKLRKAQGIEAGNEAYLDIERFLEKRNASALDSFHEAGDELTALHRLNVPSRLNVSLLSTNLIENSFRNVRRKIDRVTRWRPETEQASCWLAYALGEAEKGFHRLRDSEDLVKLHEALRLPET